MKNREGCVRRYLFLLEKLRVVEKFGEYITFTHNGTQCRYERHIYENIVIVTTITGQDSGLYNKITLKHAQISYSNEIDDIVQE